MRVVPRWIFTGGVYLYRRTYPVQMCACVMRSSKFLAQRCHKVITCMRLLLRRSHLLLIVLIFPPGNYNNSSCFLRLSPLWICSRHAVATSCLSAPPSEDPRGASPPSASLNDEFASASNLHQDEIKRRFQIQIDLEVITRMMPLVCFRSVLFCISGDLQALFFFFFVRSERWELGA